MNWLIMKSTQLVPPRSHRGAILQHQVHSVYCGTAIFYFCHFDIMFVVHPVSTICLSYINVHHFSYVFICLFFYICISSEEAFTTEEKFHLIIYYWICRKSKIAGGLWITEILFQQSPVWWVIVTWLSLFIW